MNILQTYLAYKQGTECPPNFFRWSLLSAIASMLERNVWMEHVGKLYPNMYVLLVGAPATRKSSAANNVGKLLRLSGYEKFAANKTSKQQFVEALAATPRDLDLDTWDTVDAVTINTDEFIDFIGQGNTEFIVLLAHLWDNHTQYVEEYKKRKALAQNPTVNLLSCATPANLQLGLPQEAGGTGFLSRVVCVYSEPTNIRITRPPKADEKIEADIAEMLRNVRSMQGEMQPTERAWNLIDRIYQDYIYLSDVRLAYYNGRRLTHLLKLCMCIAANYGSYQIERDHVLEANTILVYTEEQMHKSFGEYGNSKYAKVNGKIIQFMESAARPVDAVEIHTAIAGELDTMFDLYKILDNLTKGGRIQVSSSGSGKYILKRIATNAQRKYTDFKRFLAEAEDYEQETRREREFKAATNGIAAS